MHRQPLAPALLAGGALVAITFAVIFAGCGPQPVKGGTAGNLMAAGKPLSDVQVTVFQNAGATFQPIGFAVTKTDGSFQLLQNQARGPLNLAAGDYRCTLESAGAPVKIPKQFAKPETTPLKVSWSGDGKIDLNLSEKLLP